LRRIDIGDLFQAQNMPNMASPAMGPYATDDAPAMGTPAMGAPGAKDQKTGTMQPTDQKKKKSTSSCLGGSPYTTMLPLVLMFVVFYFFLIRPQQRKQKEHQALLGALRKGDQIVTTGGILGKITGLTDQYAVIEVQEKVRMKIMRSHISGKQAGGAGDSKK
jgi:preprotein translocase subunit YajC